MKTGSFEEQLKNPGIVEFLSRQYHSMLLDKALEEDAKGGDDSFVINIDASRFDRNVNGSGVMIFKCLESISKIPGVSVNNVLPHGQTYFDRFIEHYDNQSDKSNIKIRMPCCISKRCPVVLFHEALANNGELTSRHKQLITQPKNKTVPSDKTTSSCRVCGKQDELKNCSRCKSVKYCSVECQKKDWPQHKESCQTTK